MSATKTFFHDYSLALDKAWEALEEAIIAAKELNDLVYTEDGDYRCRVPGNDAHLMATKAKELASELQVYTAAKEPARLSPILPGELRLI